MSRTITVKGIGKVSAKPDYVIISMVLESSHKDYDKAMDQAAQRIQHLNETLGCIGFEKGAVKTTNFNVRTDYDHIKDRHGNYQRIFKEYEVTHHLKVAFDFSMELISQVLSAIAGCLSHPQISISFTVKDITTINGEMLRSATANARRKAEILCAASGVKLGELLAINYNWAELDIYSDTSYDCCDENIPMCAPRSIDIAPEDIDISDTATFVWEIK